MGRLVPPHALLHSLNGSVKNILHVGNSVFSDGLLFPSYPHSKQRQRQRQPQEKKKFWQLVCNSSAAGPGLPPPTAVAPQPTFPTPTSSAPINVICRVLPSRKQVAWM